MDGGGGVLSVGNRGGGVLGRSDGSGGGVGALVVGTAERVDRVLMVGGATDGIGRVLLVVGGWVAGVGGQWLVCQIAHLAVGIIVGGGVEGLVGVAESFGDGGDEHLCFGD